MLKSTIDVHGSLLTKIIDSSIRNGCFPDELKAAEVAPIFKKNDDLGEGSDRSVSVLPHVSEIIKTVMYIQIEILWKTSYQNRLQVSGKTMAPTTLDKGGFVCTIFTDLSKAFDTMNYDLLIAKLRAYSFQEDALVFMKSSFTNRRQRVCVNSYFSMPDEIISGVPQGSILGLLIFNIFLNDLVFFSWKL